MCFKVIVGSKFTVFALFYFVFEGNFPSTGPQGAYIWRREERRRVFCVTGLGGLFSEFYGILQKQNRLAVGTTDPRRNKPNNHLRTTETFYTALLHDVTAAIL